MQFGRLSDSMMLGVLVLEFAVSLALLGVVIALVVGVMLRKLRRGLDYLTKKSGISSIDS